MKKINTIIFDLGGVLIDWNPRYLFEKIFSEEREMDYFLSTICTPQWNEEQDAGRRLSDGTDILVKEYPEYELAIRSYYGRWDEMLGGSIDESVHILEELKEQNKVRLYALTNWSAETYPIAYFQYDFLQYFEDIIVSGKEGIRKPSPQIYQLACDRFKTRPESTLFIDDNLRNIKAAKKFGLQTFHFEQPEKLRKELKQVDLLD